MEIPDGFYKVYEKEQYFEYSIPEYIPVKESQRVAVETLDSLINDLFGVHILEFKLVSTRRIFKNLEMWLVKPSPQE